MSTPSYSPSYSGSGSSYGSGSGSGSGSGMVQVNPLNCNPNNQIYDSNYNVCVSCRDNTILPSWNNNQYTCINNPITTYNTTGATISYTCESGEVYDPVANKCTVIFQAKK